MFKRPTIEDVSPEDAARLREQGAVLLDVREPDEWEAGHAPDAVHVPLSAVASAADRFAGQEVVAVCRGGGRSAKAAAALAQSGITVRNVSGGMMAWKAAGLPVVRDGGAPGEVV